MNSSRGQNIIDIPCASTELGRIMLGRLAALHSLGTFRGSVDPRGASVIFCSSVNQTPSAYVFPSFVFKTFTVFYSVLSVCVTAFVHKSESLMTNPRVKFE